MCVMHELMFIMMIIVLYGVSSSMRIEIGRRAKIIGNKYVYRESYRRSVDVAINNAEVEGKMTGFPYLHSRRLITRRRIR
jgi:hypothetical protein